jgi:outer membrane immunogenic protein
MRKLATYVVAGAALIAPPASAADMAVKMPMKAPPPPPAPVYSWTGWYVDGNAGWGWGIMRECLVGAVSIESAKAHSHKNAA